MSQCATTHLIRQLDLAGAGEPVNDATFKQYATMFKGPLAPKAITALKATTRLANDDVSKAAIALAMEEMTVEVEATAT
jgi:hypothetical protein